MKMYGYSVEAIEKENSSSNELSEVVLEANSKDIRMIAEFLLQTAENMESMGSAYDHEHLSDENHYFKDSPHLVVVRPR